MLLSAGIYEIGDTCNNFNVIRCSQGHEEVGMGQQGKG
jgi:hypothetical protein